MSRIVAGILLQLLNSCSSTVTIPQVIHFTSNPHPLPVSSAVFNRVSNDIYIQILVSVGFSFRRTSRPPPSSISAVSASPPVKREMISPRRLFVFRASEANNSPVSILSRRAEAKARAFFLSIRAEHPRAGPPPLTRRPPRVLSVRSPVPFRAARVLFHKPAARIIPRARRNSRRELTAPGARPSSPLSPPPGNCKTTDTTANKAT